MKEMIFFFQLKKPLIVEQSLIVSTWGNVWRTIWRILILWLGWRGLNHLCHSMQYFHYWLYSLELHVLVLQSSTSWLLYIHTNELLLNIFFRAFWKVAHICVLFVWVSLSCTVPYNITPVSNIKVTRKKKMITNQRLWNKFSFSAPYLVWRTLWRIYILMVWCIGFKGTFN